MSASRERLIGARYATLTSVRPDGTPHAVPIVFAVVGNQLVTAVDQKPKSTRQLGRLTNIAANPAVSVLAQHDSPDWKELWWVRADGTALVTDHPDIELRKALRAKYHQYDDDPPAGPWIIVTIDRIAEWSAS